MKQSDELRQDVDALANAIVAAGGTHVRGTTFLCPFHDDRSPSMGLFERDGVWKTKCHACGFGGDVFDVRARAENRDVADVLKQVNGSPNGQHNGTPKSKPKRKARFSSIEAACQSIIKYNGGAHTARWTYHDSDGNIAFYVVRFDTSDDKY